MRKITTIKKLFLATIVLVMAQSCIPTAPTGENPTPSNTFDVNISSNTSASFIGNTQSKMLYIDGDSLLYSTSVVIGLFGGATHEFRIKPMSSGTYEYLANTQYAYYATPVDVNVHIGQNNLDSINKWINPIATNNPAANYEIYFGASTIGFPLNILGNTLPFDTDKYIVFRKSKNNLYQYYWVRIRYTDELNLHLKYTLSVLNGKYQMNSIITGQ